MHAVQNHYHFHISGYWKWGSGIHTRIHAHMLSLSHVPLFQLYKQFPNMAMVVNISAINPPTLVISPKSINFTVPGEVIVFVRFANKTLYDAFTLGVVSGTLVCDSCIVTLACDIQIVWYACDTM